MRLDLSDFTRHSRVIERADVTHIRYRIDGRSVLGGDLPA